MSRERHHSRGKDKPTGIPEPKRKKSKSVERTQEIPNDSSKTHHRSKSKSKDTEQTTVKKTHERSRKTDSESKKSKSTKLPLKEKHNEPKRKKEKEEKEQKEKDIPVPETIVQLAETYEDDFEDYTDDFESDDEDENTIRPTDANEQRPTTTLSSSSFSSEKTSEPQQPLSTTSTPPKKAVEDDVTSMPVPIMEETPLLRRLATRQGGRPPDPPEPVITNKKAPRILSAERRIDFTNASTIDPTAFTEMNERYRKLRELIVLEPVFHTIVDIPPIKDYDFYMELFGQSGKNQSSTQTGSDDVSEETQTEESLNEIKWTQHPPHDDYGWGSESTAREGVDWEEDEKMAMFRENHLQNPRLKQFLEAAGQVVIDLITSRRKTAADLVLQNKSVFSFSLGYNSFELGPISQLNHITSLSLNPKEPDLVLAGFFIKESPADDIVNRTLLVEFFLEQSQPPKRLYLSDGDVTSTCYTSDGSVLVAGVVDGSVEAFDLLEPSSAFSSSMPWIDSPVDIALRSPAYDSSFLSSTLADGKAHPIVDVQIMENEHDYTSQMASLDQSGSVSLWIVLRDSQGRPGAASSKGPRLLASKINVYSEVLCAKVSPFDSSVFLVGFSSGSIAVYRLSHVNPTVVLTPPSSSRKPVTSIEWSPIVRLIVVRHKADFGYFSHLISPTVLRDAIFHEIPSKVTSTMIWLEKNENKSSKGIAYLALGLSTGEVQVHALETIRAKREGNLSAILKMLDD
ncbi:hypothetical protein GCK32_007432 [Trichostrongylus colubriformis]|uniref:Uncharacterized protein n=1 Tax=Trichostrongylus colubriformis TaxID=6319 RepID=A0AAN8IS14_TRICO